MKKYLKLGIEEPRPYFAEIPYYLWGQVNYNSDGNCKHPTDRLWTCLETENRETGELVIIEKKSNNEWIVKGDEFISARVALFLCDRLKAKFINSHPENFIGDWNHNTAMNRTKMVVEEFNSSILKPFDIMDFWGSWKWIGWFSTDFTWIGRWIMVSVLNNDSKGVFLCVNWLKKGTRSKNQSYALRYALNRFTNKSFNFDQEWIDWYYGKGGRKEYPEPNFDQWLKELKSQYPE